MCRPAVVLFIYLFCPTNPQPRSNCVCIFRHVAFFCIAIRLIYEAKQAFVYCLIFPLASVSPLIYAPLKQDVTDEQLKGPKRSGELRRAKYTWEHGYFLYLE